MNFEHHTEHLLIKVLHPDYASLVLDFYKRNHDFLKPFEPSRFPNFYTLELQKTNLSCEYNAFIKSTYMRVWLFQRENPSTAIGTICFSNYLHGAFCSCMVGYKMDKDHLQKGYMAEALSYLLPLVCREYHFHRVEAYVMPSNLPSIALLEKLGFQSEGFLHEFAQIQGKWQDHLLYTYFSEQE